MSSHRKYYEQGKPKELTVDECCLSLARQIGVQADGACVIMITADALELVTSSNGICRVAASGNWLQVCNLACVGVNTIVGSIHLARLLNGCARDGSGESKDTGDDGG